MRKSWHCVDIAGVTAANHAAGIRIFNASKQCSRIDRSLKGVMVVGMASWHATLAQLPVVMVSGARSVFQRGTCHLFRLMEMVIKGRLDDKLPQDTQFSCRENSVADRVS